MRKEVVTRNSKEQKINLKCRRKTNELNTQIYGNNVQNEIKRAKFCPRSWSI